MKPAFTIIIPHKNIPNLLMKCLNSIPQRDDLQIVVVDDDSDPQIVDFSNFPGSDRNDVKIILTKEGRGAGYARNVGLKQVKSKWVLFADADDYFSDEFATFLDKYQSSDADLIFYENQTIDIQSQQFLEKDLMVAHFKTQSSLENDYEPLRYMTHAPWTKMVRTDLIWKHCIRFQETIAANDVWFAVQVGYYANEIEISDLRIYIRTIRPGSLFYSFKAENLLARIEAGYKTNRFLKKVGKLEYYVETWGYFLDLRKISWSLFLKNVIPYFYHTPVRLVWKHIKYELLKNANKKNRNTFSLCLEGIGCVICAHDSFPLL